MIGPYEVLGVLGQGGMGTVLRGRHPALGVVRAIKVLEARRGPDAARAAARFEREARSLAGISHPNVVHIHESGLEGGAPWFAMDLVEGETLEDVVHRGPLPLERALDLVLGVCRGVDALHAAGVVHRDLKPQNVIVTPDGRPVVIDLGLAVAPERDERLTRTGALVGTPFYMAPEQVEGGEVSPRTDVHAIGLLLYEVVTGEVALGAGRTSVHQVVGAILARERPVPSDLRPDLPVALDRLCARAMARDPAGRFERAGDLAGAIEALGARPGPSRRLLRQRRLVVALLAGAALVSAGAAVAVVRGRRPGGRGGEVAAVASAPGTDAAPATVDAGRASAAARELRRVASTPLPERRREAAQAWLARFPDDPRAPEARRLEREAARAVPLARLDHPSGRTFGRFVGDDPDHLVTAAGDGTLRLWARGRTGVFEEQRRWEAGGPALALITSADRRRVLLTVEGAQMRTLRPLEDDELKHLPFVGDVEAVAVSADERRIAVAPRGPTNAVRVVDLDAIEMTDDLAPAGSPVHALVYARSGLLLAATGQSSREGGPLAADQAVRGLRDGEVEWSADVLSEATCLALSPDEALVAVGCSSGQLLLLDPRSGEQRGELHGEGAVGEGLLPAAHGGGVKALVFSRDGRRLYSVSEVRGQEGGELRAWSIPDGRELRAPVRCPAPGRTLDLSPDGAALLLSTREGRVELWSADVD
jgi:serine/threonine-protein kinase